MPNHLKESLKSSFTSGILILKLVIPFYILADILLYFDLLHPVSFIFSPVTSILQLPAETAMAICSGVFLNIYAAVAFAAPLGLSSYEWTILGVFLGVCHGLPIENSIMKKLGISFLYSTCLRVSMAFLTTFPLFFLPSSLFTGEKSDNTIQLASYSSVSEMLIQSLSHAALLSVKIIGLISAIIFLMDALKRTQFIQNYGQRVQTSFSLLTGQLLGITYGAGILFKEAESGNLKKKDIFFIGTFLMICHSLLEDPLLFVLFGANYWVMIISRLVMACIATFLLSKLYDSYHRRHTEKKRNLQKTPSTT